jgi:2-polyprenyl-3-methyl-5-hydroxy-6-metoxy-1,4-benzoquinol methylase
VAVTGEREIAFDTDSERRRLEDIALDSWYAKGPNGTSVAYSARVLSRFWRGNTCLELGPAEGITTEFLVRRFDSVTVVDGSEHFCRLLEERFPDVEVVCSLFEDYAPSARYDTIVLGHVLEHVDDPAELLASVRDWLAPNGLVFGAVPNARSVHRQAAVIMGLLPDERAMNETDHHHGHRRVYDPESLRNDFRNAGYRIAAFGGYFLKPVSNRQIEETWTSEMLDAFMELGERYPDIAGEIYVAATA